MIHKTIQAVQKRITLFSLILAISTVFAVAPFGATAQLRNSSGMDLSLQAGLAFPVSGDSTVASGAYDFSLTVSMPVSMLIDLTAGVAYERFGQTDRAITDSQKTVNNIPVFAGIRFLIDGSTVLPYFGGEFSVNDLVYHSTVTGTKSIPDVVNIKFGIAILAGVRIPFSQTLGADLTAKYHDIPNTGEPDIHFVSIEAGIVAHLNL